jgi:hypothetical protein
MRRSNHTLIGRVHEQARLEVQHDVEALYQFLDPVIRARREEQRDEPRLTLSGIRAFVEGVRSAEVEEVEILEARKVSNRHGGRPAALVRSIVRYNNKPAAAESRTTWVRDHGVWYSTALNKRWSPAA